MITVQNLTKRYGDRLAVSDVSFSVRPGIVTGFLGPNGAGKSTTMRMIVGLDRPTSGSATVGGHRYASLASPLTHVGIMLDAKAVHTGRTARNHLRAMAATHGIPISRVDEVLDLTGLTSVARKRAGRFSLGMGQRLGIASALLGDPDVLILDEPVNGLDPEGVRWVRDLVRSYAALGRTVLLSSHLMSEMALTADHLLVLGRGRLIADAPLSDIVRDWTREEVLVRSPRAAELAGVLRSDVVSVEAGGPDELVIVGAPASWISDRAAAAGIPLHQLATRTGSLEEAYMALTGDTVEYKTKQVA
ncbi:ABC transporter ATP-binding protein [Microbacterium gorillae]|uniref:ABC transporter ATP-binding protein n=1 Tax=Microbacterium gorillae TaxID=1231063 RepID=UPI00058DE523|nr:ATP-binding cassette domain-containing protein [Microbacterium gorillae]